MKLPDDALSAKLVLITGKEELLRLEALRQVLAASGIDGDDFDSEAFVADARQPVEWVASASTIPFLSDRRTVVVRNVLRVDPDPSKEKVADGAKPLLPLFKDLPDTARIILVADDETGGEDKKRSFDGVDKKWQSLIKKVNGTAIVCDIPDNALAIEFARIVEDAGKKLSNPAAELLVEMTGGSYSRAVGEIQKLILYVGDAAEIREADVKAAVTPSREWNMWALLDAVRERRLGEAIRQLRILMGSNRKLEEAAYQTIFPQLSRYFRLLWQARLCVERNVMPTNAPESMLMLFLEKPNIVSEKPGTLNRILPQARKVTLAQISACLQEVALADARLKGAEPSGGTEDTIERLLMRLAEILAPAPR